ncbi:HNH endonuclease [Candidatus Saccharibacteria bacterium]|nr:HNH endonuclease [Candidatus Saccharibacteria bacterium]
MKVSWIEVPDHWTDKDVKRFRSKIKITEQGCYQWTGARSKNGKGYAFFSIDGKVRILHRYLYQHMVEKLNDSKQLDHLCRNMGCVNTDHLEPVTLHENVVIRGTGITAENYKKTTCPQGHPYSGINSHGRRICRKCQRKQLRESRLRAKTRDG